MFTIREDPLASIAPDWPVFVGRALSSVGLAALEPHLHEVIISTLFYTIIYKLSCVLSPKLVSQYSNLTKRNQVNFDLHVVSQVQSPLICLLSFPLFFDKQIATLTDSSSYSKSVVAYCIGYFIWDLWVCLEHRKLFGLGFVAHALAALVTFTCCALPMLHKYAGPFIWFEASTPFVNIHWFAGHVPGMISDRTRIVNGLALLLVFFLARIVSGPYNGLKLFRDIAQGLPENCPTWVMAVVLTCYFTLTGLNFIWFFKMVSAARNLLLSKSKQD